MEYRSLLGQPRELLYLQLSDVSVSYGDMVNICNSSTKARNLCEKDPEFQKLKQRKIENLLLELTYLKVKELCEKHEEIQEVCNSDEFWKRKSHRDFRVSYEFPSEGRAWKEEYRELGRNYTSGLIFAVENGEASQVQMLLDVGVDPNTRDESRGHGYPVLMDASNNGYTNIVRMLLKAGANIDAKDRYHGASALMAASANGKPKVVELLLSAGADVNARDNREETALMDASREGHPDIVRMLISAGANVNAQNKYGDTVLMIASRGSEKPDIIKMLIDAGAKK